MRKSLHTADIPVNQPATLIMPDDGPVVREPETIVLVDKNEKTDYLDELKFMEEPVTIRLEKGSEKFAPTLLPFYVNGRPEWVPVGRPWTIARKYVEVIARCQPFDVQTEHDDESAEHPQNRVIRSQRTKFPFSVIEDKNPRGYDWLTKLIQEN